MSKSFLHCKNGHYNNIYYYSEVNTESEIHFDTNDFDTFDTVSEMSFEWIK